MDLTKQNLEIAGCLRRLMKSRFLLRSKNERWFQAIIDLRAELQIASQSFAMTLEVNEALGVAFLKPMSDEIEETLAYQVGRRRTLGPLSAALVYKLRIQRLQFYLNPSSEAVALMTVEEMREFVQNFNSAKIDSQFERLFRKSLEELEELQIIQETRPDSGVFEITALCEVLLPLDGIQEVKARMENYFSEEPQSGSARVAALDLSEVRASDSGWNAGSRNKTGGTSGDTSGNNSAGDGDVG